MLSDGEGLYLKVTPNGSRLWRLKYQFEGKEKLVAREDIAMGIDPSREKRLAKAKSKAEAEITFNLMAAEFCKKRKSDGKGAGHPRPPNAVNFSCPCSTTISGGCRLQRSNR